MKPFSMESSGACQSVSLGSGLSVQTTSFLQRAEWLQWVFIVNDKMLWFRKIIFQQSHRNMCFLNQFLWNQVQGLFCPSTQSLFTQRLFFCCTFHILLATILGYLCVIGLSVNPSSTVAIGFDSEQNVTSFIVYHTPWGNSPGFC